MIRLPLMYILTQLHYNFNKINTKPEMGKQKRYAKRKGHVFSRATARHLKSSYWKNRLSQIILKRDTAIMLARSFTFLGR